MRKAWARVSAVVVLAAISCAAQAQTTVEFKSITIVVGSSAGGGYDTYARVLARHIGRHIPGQPSVTVQNMPGAASLAAVQYLLFFTMNTRTCGRDRAVIAQSADQLL